MKTIITCVFVVVGFLLCRSGISLAQDCEDAEDSIRLRLRQPPQADTEYGFKTAFEDCPGNQELYELVGDYWEKHAKTHRNINRRIEFKEYAKKYYELAEKMSSGREKRRYAIKVAEVEKMDVKPKKELRNLGLIIEDYSGDPANISEAQVAEAAETATDEKRWTIPIFFFGFDSYEVNEVSEPYLDEVGEYLIANPSCIILLEGHADARGDPGYNKTLSLKRAESAKSYLEDNYEIASERIRVLGYGSDRLKDKNDPYSAVNRRVELLKIVE